MMMKSYWRTVILTWLSLFMLLMVSCYNGYTKPTPTSLAQTSVPLIQSTAMTAPPTVTPRPSRPVVLDVPTSSPTLTPSPQVSVHVPDRWLVAATEAVQELDLAGNEYRWFIAPENEQANLTLVAGDAGLPAGRRDLALSVPFTTNWEAVTLGEALELLDNQHQLVEVMEWSEMGPNRKALRVDGLFPGDAAYPIQQTWSLLATPGYEKAAQDLAAALESRITQDPVVTLAAVGDIMLDRALGYAIEQGDLAYPFSGVVDRLAEADITVGNLESALGDVGQPASKSYTFRAPVAASQSLALAGIDVISLANNHAMDYGPETLLQAIDLLNNQGVGTIGAGADRQTAHEPHIVEIDGLSLAFLGYVNVPVEVSGFDTQSWTATDDLPGLAWAEPVVIAADVAKASERSDLVIVVLHSGFEYLETPSPPQVSAARAAIDAGADLVIGHHTHVLQGVEFYNSGVIVYGLGNFAFEIDGDPTTAILNVWLDGQGVRQLEFVPAIIQFGGQPRLAEEWETPAILQQIYRLTGLLNVE